MNIWVDLANSPQVLVLRPLLAEMERRGHRVYITTRDYAQTVPLANEYRLTHTVVGVHGKTRWFDMAAETWSRAQGLASWLRTQPRMDLAVSHNSLGQALAAWRAGLPFVTLMDYEYQPANHIIFRSARRVIVPECFPDARLRAFGGLFKTKKYPGIKEQLYLSDTQLTPDYLKTVGINSPQPLIVMRPPAPWAAYHRNFADTLFDDLLQSLAAQPVTIVFLPRVGAQRERVRAMSGKNLWIPDRVLDGPDLIFHADAVISGGGTMNREAGILGTPAYTVFKGKLGSADEWLVARGRLKQITSTQEFPDIASVAQKRQPILPDGHLVKHVTTLILEAV